MFDYHVHSNVSFDGYDSPARIAMTAEERGFTEICFTEHQEIDYPYVNEVKPELDYALYTRELAKARGCAPKLIIKRGVEVSLMPDSLAKISADIGTHDFDFVIASQHTINGKDPYFGDNFVGKTPKEAQKEYLEEMLFNLERYTDYDVVGHIGYIDKYLVDLDTREDKKPFEYYDFTDLLDAILSKIISQGKGIEVNTGNYYAYDWPTPIKSVLRRFTRLGGEHVTLGSDAHFADVIGYRFDEAMEYIKECGVKYVCKYTARKPEFIRVV
ncbi:MAG: histidinol-phosphatase HisJ family protein [Christensenella sp.]